MSAKRALLSVSDKTGIVEFAQGLIALGWEIISSGGTAKHLREAGVLVTDVAEITGMGPILDHRVVTLHPKIHGGILGKRPEHLEEMATYGIVPISLVCVDLYPVQDKIADPQATLQAVLDLIDIGGPTLLRGAAKNYQNVIVICDPVDRQMVLHELQTKQKLEDELRLLLAIKVFDLMEHYDGAIERYLLGEQRCRQRGENHD